MTRTTRLVALFVAMLALVALVAACGNKPAAETIPVATQEPAEAPAAQVDPGALAAEYPNKPHHQDAELSCTDCHGEIPPSEPATMETCLDCHGPLEDLVAATERGEHHPNPHNSPHYGPDNACDLCHYEHEQSENMCGDCHEWATAVP